MKRFFQALCLGVMLVGSASVVAPVATAAQTEQTSHHTPFSGDDDADGTPNWLDADAGEHFALNSLLWHTLNLALFFGLIGWAAWPRIQDIFRKRSLQLHSDLVNADTRLREARERHDTALARLQHIEQEIDKIAAQSREQTELEVARIEERALAADARLRESIEHHLRDEIARAERVVRAEAVDLAIELARGVLSGQVQAQDQATLARALLTSVDAEKEGLHA